MSDTAMQLTMTDGIACLTFDRPNARANVLSTPVWQEFGRHLDSLAVRSDLRGLIVDSAKPGVFIAGADLQEIHDTPPNDTGPTQALITLGHRVLEKLEALPYPTVAVIDGAALGGGLEVALACDFRICGTHPKVQLGLPEVKLGLIPGWGGTQRLPRLVGVEEAVNRLLSGESYDATDPPPEDLVDETVASEILIETALRWLKEGDWREIRDVKRSPVPADLLPSPDFLDVTRQALEAIDEDLRPAALAALKAVLQGSTLPLKDAIPFETEAFLKLVGTATARDRIAAFLAKRAR